MTISILQVLATLPSGKEGPALTTDELGHYLRTHCDTEHDKDRARRHTLREELYRDGGISHMEKLIEDTFKDKHVRDLRKQWVRYARFNNTLRRVVHELATVYTEPARRLVEGEPNNERYQRALDAVQMDERALEISRLLNLHRALVVGVRVRKLPDGTREPTLDIASPATARAVLHPNDSSVVVGWMIRTSYRSARETNLPAWTLWTDHESIQLRENLTPIGDPEPHAFGVCPWTPVTLGPSAPGFFPGHEGEDLVAAHIAIWFNNVLLLKESKSATKQGVISGDGALTARGQAADSEVPTELADGQSVTTIDLSMDLSLFRATADHVLTHAGLNYGLPPSVLMHQGVQSAEARELQRIPLKELRRQQQVPLRRFERQLARALAGVFKEDLPDLAFDASTWRIQFAESETPLDPAAEHELFLKRRAAGLDNTIAALQRLHPGLTPEQALAELKKNILVETERNREMRPMEAISGSPGADNLPAAGEGTPPAPPKTDSLPSPEGSLDSP